MSLPGPVSSTSITISQVRTSYGLPCGPTKTGITPAMDCLAFSRLVSRELWVIGHKGLHRRRGKGDSGKRKRKPEQTFNLASFSREKLIHKRARNNDNHFSRNYILGKSATDGTTYHRGPVPWNRLFLLQPLSLQIKFCLRCEFCIPRSVRRNMQIHSGCEQQTFLFHAAGDAGLAARVWAQR